MHQGQKRLMCFDCDERSRSGSRGKVVGVGGVSVCQAALDTGAENKCFIVFLFCFFAGRLSLKGFFLPSVLFLALLGLSGERSVKTSEGGCHDVGTGRV